MWPVTFNQERHLVAEEIRALKGYAPTGLRAPLIFRLDVAVARNQIEYALNRIVSRHGALRNSYGPTDRYSHSDRMRQLQVFNRTGLFVPGLFVQRPSMEQCLGVAEVTVRDDDGLAEFVR